MELPPLEEREKNTWHSQISSRIKEVAPQLADMLAEDPAQRPSARQLLDSLFRQKPPAPSDIPGPTFLTGGNRTNASLSKTHTPGPSLQIDWEPRAQVSQTEPQPAPEPRPDSPPKPDDLKGQQTPDNLEVGPTPDEPEGQPSPAPRRPGLRPRPQPAQGVTVPQVEVSKVKKQRAKQAPRKKATKQVQRAVAEIL